MARLADGSGLSIDIQPVGYEFDARRTAFGTDRNWLLVRVTVVEPGRAWTAEAPALLTWDLPDLTQWCRTLTWQPENSTRVWDRAMEPSLALEADRTPAGRELRVRLNLDILPPERRDGAYHEGEDVDLVFHPTEEDLSRFVAELSRDASAFPRRD